MSEQFTAAVQQYKTISWLWLIPLFPFVGAVINGIFGKRIQDRFGKKANHSIAIGMMALAAGVQMSECRLHEENGRAHFMTRRFDRQGNRKIHMHSLCGLAHLDYNTPSVHGYEQYLRTILQLNLGAPAVEQAWLRCAFNVAAVNCDDHTKNLAFLMDQTGRWSLSPAYDMCFSHNPAPGKWTRQHQMLVRGKAWDITEEDLLELARSFDVRRSRALLDGVIDAVARWPQFAQRAGVLEEKIEHVASFQPDWVKRRRTGA